LPLFSTSRASRTSTAGAALAHELLRQFRLDAWILCIDGFDHLFHARAEAGPLRSAPNSRRHASESWHPAFIAALADRKRDARLRWGDGTDGVQIFQRTFRPGGITWSKEDQWLQHNLNGLPAALVS